MRYLTNVPVTSGTYIPEKCCNAEIYTNFYSR